MLNLAIYLKASGVQILKAHTQKFQRSICNTDFVLQILCVRVFVRLNFLHRENL